MQCLPYNIDICKIQYRKIDQRNINKIYNISSKCPVNKISCRTSCQNHHLPESVECNILFWELEEKATTLQHKKLCTVQEKHLTSPKHAKCHSSVFQILQLQHTCNKRHPDVPLILILPSIFARSATMSNIIPVNHTKKQIKKLSFYSSKNLTNSPVPPICHGTINKTA